MQQGNFFPLRISNYIHVLRKYFSNHVYLKDIDKNLEEIRITQFALLLKILVYEPRVLIAD